MKFSHAVPDSSPAHGLDSNVQELYMDHSARPTEDERVANAKPLVRAWKPLLFAALALVPVAIGLTFLDVETQNPIVHGIGVVVAFAILVLLALSILTAWAGAAKLSSETRKTERSPNSR